MPRSVLAAATFVAFVAGAADQPVQAKEASPKHPGKGSAALRHAHLARHRSPHTAPDATASLAPRQVGIASWYAGNLTGQVTASGDFFDPGRLTAAHRNLPLGTRIRVTRLATGDSVIVVVNDRGPYVRGRVLDLSPAAAHGLRVPPGQNLPVKIEIVSLPQPPVRTAHR